MSDATERLETFLAYTGLLKGDEKGEAQVFCDRLFQAFGHKGYKEAGAELEYRIKKHSTGGTSFADLIWKPRLLIEMKKRGENLFHHYKQAFEYWIHAVPNRPRYVILCNFDEFWIYDFDKQIDEPVDIVELADLPRRYTALNFLFPDDLAPIFRNDLEAVSREAADKVSQLFKAIVARGIDRARAQRFVLQLVVAMFAEDIGLLPSGIVYQLADDSLHKGQSAYDLFGSLFTQMNTKQPAAGGRFKDVPYFNGGVFQTIEPVDLKPAELELICKPDEGAATKDWSKVNPAIFGTIFQQSMDADERHAYGAHFTSEADIMRIITPTISRPWAERIAKASTMKDLLALRGDLMSFKVLDPACGSGNFLYLAYRELVRIEIALMTKLKATVSEANFLAQAKTISLVSPQQFFGIDRDSFGVELAKVTLMLAKKLAIDEAIAVLERDQIELPLHGDDALPLDNLDLNIRCDDALFCEWPEVAAIIGNPPYQSKNKMQQELGRAYVNAVRDKFPDVDGRADYCVYWFRKAHDCLHDGERAGLVGTNTIRQNYSRTGGLDYIASNGGTITEAVSTMKWSGEAAVDVSIVNWVRGEVTGKKRLYAQSGNHPAQGWSYRELDLIGPSLSFATDVTQARVIQANAARGGCYQGQTHGHEGFLLTPAEAEAAIAQDARNEDVLFPYLIGEDLVGSKDSRPRRYVIDFQPRALLEANAYSSLFKRLQTTVLPTREQAAQEEEARNAEAIAANPAAKINRHHATFLDRWWLLSYARSDLVKAISQLDRYIACARVTLRPVFEFVSTTIRPSDVVMVFPYDDDYSFGILQSGIHWTWFTNRCSTLTGRYRYTSNTVFDSFPWPQQPTSKAVENVAKASVELRALRRELRQQHDISFRELYRSLELPGASPMKDAQAKLDQAVRDAYGMGKSQDVLAFLLDLNQTVANRENAGEPVVGPGLPPIVKERTKFASHDCIRMQEGNTKSAAMSAAEEGVA
jgi:type II restriction/modification system DNA methylase subunit YeeA